MEVLSHYNIRRVVDIYGSVQDRDLGAVGRDVTRIVDQNQKLLPRGSFFRIRGQLDTMRTSYEGLLAGLGFAIVLVYFLIVVNFQSWLDPFIIITALPAALAGIIVFLFLTHTTLSVPALMGAIMCMGVATANSILVVAFATERLASHGDPLQAAIEAGFTRFRPVLMTALAMIIGMIPMALGLGDGGEENAPLGRAVIGGLLCATVATLVFVPTVFGLLHGMRLSRGNTQKPGNGESQCQKLNTSERVPADWLLARPGGGRCARTFHPLRHPRPRGSAIQPPSCHRRSRRRGGHRGVPESSLAHR